VRLVVTSFKSPSCSFTSFTRLFLCIRQSLVDLRLQMTDLLLESPESLDNIMTDALAQLQIGSSIRQSFLGLFKRYSATLSSARFSPFER
jgi:uncharacterized protein (UPF0212 family)